MTAQEFITELQASAITPELKQKILTLIEEKGMTEDVKETIADMMQTSIDEATADLDLGEYQEQIDADQKILDEKLESIDRTTKEIEARLEDVVTTGEAAISTLQKQADTIEIDQLKKEIIG